MIWEMMTLPIRIASRAADRMTGGSEINIDSEHTVPGNDPGRWADAFARDPTMISPLTVGASRHGRTTTGRPFPGGPKIGITVRDRRDQRLANGCPQTVLEIHYSGDFEGPGRITITQVPGKGLVVRDQWLGVKNHSMLPSRGAEIGHPLVAGMGFDSIGRRSRSDAGNGNNR